MEKKKLYILISLVLCVLLMIIIASRGAGFSERGRDAVECVTQMKTRVDNPASFLLTEDAVVFEVDEGGLLGKRVCVVHYSSKNSRGIHVDGSGVFLDGMYLGSLDELERDVYRVKNDTSYTSYEKRGKDLERVIPLMQILKQYSGIQLMESMSKGFIGNDNASDKGYELVSAERIGKKLNIPYYK